MDKKKREKNETGHSVGIEEEYNQKYQMHCRSNVDN